MFNCTRSMRLVCAINSYSRIFHGGRWAPLFKEKFLSCGSVLFKSTASQKSKLRKVLDNEKIWDFDTFVDNVPRKFWRAKSDFRVTYSFAIHEKTAEEITSAVMDSVFKKQKMPTVIELNPGLGLITKKLFERGLQSLIVYNQFCFEPFKDLLEKYSGKIELHEVNPLNTEAGLQLTTYLHLFNYLTTVKDNEVIITAVSPNRLFFRRLLFFITNFSFSCGKNVEFYLTIPDEIYNCMMCSSNRNSRASDYGCFSLLFHVEVLNKYPRDYFLPLSIEANAGVFFVRLERNTAIIEKEDLLMYRNFLKLLGSSKANNVIGELEKWFPGSGLHLIANGVPVTKQTFEMQAEDLFELFKFLKELKGYEESFSMLGDYDANSYTELKH